ncbi:unnamed protein product, partial [Ectocarpus sp. 12 AP-2014]
RLLYPGGPWAPWLRRCCRHWFFLSPSWKARRPERQTQPTRPRRRFHASGGSSKRLVSVTELSGSPAGGVRKEGWSRMTLVVVPGGCAASRSGRRSCCEFP